MIISDNYTHGGDVYKNDVRLDFSANVNPLGTPEPVRQAVIRSAGALAAYPDPYCGRLREKLAAFHGVSPRDILCGSGAAELIFQFAMTLRPQTALLPVPSFSEYESALLAAGCRPRYFSLSRAAGFAVTAELVEAVTPETELLLLCSPNNPTGICVPWPVLSALLKRCRETGTWLFLDECFLDLTDPELARSLIPALEAGDRVFLLRAFTKLYGMAGVRLGYAVCREHAFTEKMCRLIQPWNISAPAQAAGEAALDCDDFVQETRALIQEEKQYLLRELRRLGIDVLPGAANFLMLSGVPGLYDALLQKKILIRRCDNYRGLGAGDCRIAVRTHGENAALIAALEMLCHA